jgi:rod shape-determining protein MreC
MAVYRRTSRRRYVLLLVVLTSVTLITLDRRDDDPGALGAVGRVAHAIVAPVERGVDAVARPVGNWFDGVFEAGSLEADNERLRERIAALESEVREGEAARQHNRDLLEAINLPVLDDVERVVAQVVNTSYGNFEETITLNRGSSHGVQDDMAVIVHNGVVGRVVEVWGDGCKVRLLTDPRFSVAARVVETGVNGIASGRRSELLGLELTNAPRRSTTRVERGQRIETSGFEGSSFPSGLQLGEVVSVREQQSGLPPEVRVDPFADLDNLEYVAILLWSPGEGTVTTTTTTTTTTTPGTSTTTTTTPEADE